MNPTPQDIATSLTKAGCDRLPAPALAYIGARMGRSDLTRLNLGGLRPISYGCATARPAGTLPIPCSNGGIAYVSYADATKLGAVDLGGTWDIGGVEPLDVSTAGIGGTGSGVAIGVGAVLLLIVGSAALAVRSVKNAFSGDTHAAACSAAADCPMVICKDGSKSRSCVMGRCPSPEGVCGPDMNGKSRGGVEKVGDAGEPFDPALIRGTVDDTEEFDDLDAAARALVSVAYRAAPRAWGQVGEAELATLGSYPIHRAKVGAAKAVDDLGESIDALKTAVDGLAADIGGVDSWTYYRDDGDDHRTEIADGIRDTNNYDSVLRAKYAEDIKAGSGIFIWRQKGKQGRERSVVVINTTESADIAPPGVDAFGAVGASHDSKPWTYYRVDGERAETIATDIHDTAQKDSELRAKFSDEPNIEVWRESGPRIVRVLLRRQPVDGGFFQPSEMGEAVGATPSPIPGLPSVQDTLAAAQQVLSQVAPQASATTDMGPRKVYPSGISPEMESTMRALVADWEGFDRLGVGTKVLPDLRPAVEQFRKLRDAWKAGSNDPAVVSQEIDAATKAASQVREALAKAGVIDPALGPAAIKATQDAILAAQQAAAASSKSWLDNVPALKWLSNPNGPTVRVTTDQIVPAEWRAPIVVGVAGLAIVGAWFALSSRKASRSAARSG